MLPALAVLYAGVPNGSEKPPNGSPKPPKGSENCVRRRRPRRKSAPAVPSHSRPPTAKPRDDDDAMM